MRASESLRPPRLALAVLLLFAGACGSLRGTHRSAQFPVQTIARYEDARDDGDGLLETLLASGSEPTRERAAFALGRLPFPGSGATVTAALCSALVDESPRVRAAAAFALGLRADPGAADALLLRQSDAESAVRARVVEAASRIDDGRLRALVLNALEDPSEVVRAEAAIGPHRWKPDAPDADEVDEALLDLTREATRAGETWRALFSLARRKCELARGAFEAGLSCSDARARIFAAQGLKSLPHKRSSDDALRAALSDADWRVVCEAALALGEHPDPEAVPELSRAMEHASAHVRRCVAEALGHFAASKDAVRPLLERARVDVSANVRGAALVSQVRLQGDEVASEVEALADREDPRLRAGAATAAALLPDGKAVPLLVRLSKDKILRVADIAARGLKDHPTPEARARIAALLEDGDNGLRLAAAETLKEIGGPEDLERLGRCLATSRGDISGEIASNVLDAAARIGGETARGILERGTSHSDPFVRRKAEALLAKSFPGSRVTSARLPENRPSRVPLPGIDYPAGGPNPRVEIVTNRGSLVFELLRDETPVHVFNFLALARRGFYDGLTFHRVVPDFVIQGGDPRGDGNGGTTWRGVSLRGEFTPRKFSRGSLGMPRNDDPDSGGCQIFVTHRETPHLDGRYTLFGELREGFDVLDAIEVGDTIRKVRILGDVAPR